LLHDRALSGEGDSINCQMTKTRTTLTETARRRNAQADATREHAAVPRAALEASDPAGLLMLQRTVGTPP
jgi:hypothetical protein